MVNILQSGLQLSERLASLDIREDQSRATMKLFTLNKNMESRALKDETVKHEKTIVLRGLKGETVQTKLWYPGV